ncbi:hypothetical protein CLOP_g9123 [Closterium sp. NIES-67]|nr:hypothetical protein CLOP_g9123 [Closterium sp. NIES-67]
MPHSSEAITSPSQSQSSSLAVKPWSAEEDAVLLRHALHCGTRQWGELGRSGQLKRNNKSCCNRYIFLRRKFVQRFQQNLLREQLGGAAFPQHIALEAHSQLLLRRDGQQQQHQQQKHQHQQQQYWHQPQPQQQGQQGGVGSPGSQSPALTFGGLSFEECRSVFLSPNARPLTAQASLASASTAAASNAAFPGASFSSASLSGASLPGAAADSNAPAVSNAAVSNIAATSDRASDADAVASGAMISSSAALSLPMKRPTEDWRGPTPDPLLPGRAERWAGCILRHSQSLEERFQLQGSGSGLLDDLLLEAHRHQRGGGSSRQQRVVWPRVESESALPDDGFLGFSSQDPGFIIQVAALPAPLLNQLPLLPDSAGGGLSTCLGQMFSVGNISARQELIPPMTACSAMPESDSLPLPTPAPHQWLPGPGPPVPMPRLPSALTPCTFSRLPLASEPQGRAQAVTGAGAFEATKRPALPEWAIVPGGRGEGVPQTHRHQQRPVVPQRLELQPIPSIAKSATFTDRFHHSSSGIKSEIVRQVFAKCFFLVSLHVNDSRVFCGWDVMRMSCFVNVTPE